MRAATVALLAIALAPRSARAQGLSERLRASLEHELQERIVGKVRVGGVAGDLFSSAEISDVEIDDLDGEAAVRVKRIRLAYSPGALLSRTVQLQAVKIEGVEIRARYLRDGRLNLAALSRPAAPSPSGGGGSTFQIVVARVVAEPVLFRFEPPPARGRPIEIELRLEGDATLSSAGAEVHLTALRGLSQKPLRAEIDGSAGVRVDAAGAATLERVRIHLLTDGDELNRVIAGARLIGRYEADLTADGATGALAVKLAVKPPAGALTVEGTVAAGAALLWDLRASSQALNPAALWRGAPAGRFTVEAKGRGSDGSGTVEVTRLELASAGLRGVARGTIDLQGALGGELTVEATDLTRLAGFGLPGLTGSLTGHGRVTSRGDHLRLDGEARAEGFGWGAWKARDVEATVRTDDFTGAVRCHARDVGFGAGAQATSPPAELRLDTLTLAVDGTRSAVTLHAEGAGPEETRLILDGSAPALRRGHAISAALDRFTLQRHGIAFASVRAAQVVIDDGVQVHGLEVAARDAALTVDGRIGRGGRLDLTLAARALDAAAIARFAGASIEPPHTRLDGALHARGTLAAPVVDLDLGGDSLADPHLGLDAIHYRLRATLAEGRLRGDLITTLGMRLESHFDLPTGSGVHPLHLTVTVDGVPARALGIEGAIALKATVGGTTAHPELDATLSAPSVTISGERFRIEGDARYRGLTLTAHLVLGAEAGGALEGALTLPIDLGGLGGALAQTGAAPRRDGDGRHRAPRPLLLTALPVDASVVARAFDLARLPPRYRPAAGRLDGAVRLTGTLAAPSVAGELRGSGLAVAAMSGLDLAAILGYDHDRATVTAQVDRGGARLLNAHGDVAVDLARLTDGARAPIAWSELPLHLDAELPGYPLSRVWSALGGTLRGSAALRGTPARPVARLFLDGSGVRLGADRLPVCRATLTVERGAGDSPVAAHLDLAAADPKGGTLHVDGAVPLDGVTAPRLRVRAHRFAFDLPATGGDLVRSFRGTVDAELTYGAVATATATGHGAAGWLRVTAGTLLLTDGAARRLIGADTLPYERIALDATLAGDRLELGALTLTHGGGTLSARGHLELDRRFRPLRLDAEAVFAHLPLLLAPHGVWGAWFDADVALRADLTLPIPRFEVDVRHGAARLPKIDISREQSLQPIGALEDVAFVGDAPDAPAAGAPLHTLLIARLLGPFQIRSTAGGGQLGVDLDLRGALTVDLDGQVTRVSGAVEARSGEATLFGRPFAIERGRLWFPGTAPPDPTIDLRITRDIADATVVLEAGGTLRRPEVRWFSEPPTFDRQQVERIIVSGDPTGGPDDSSDQRAVADLSSVIGSALKGVIAPHLALFDVVRVSGASDGATGESNGVEIGKYLTDHLYFSLVHQFITLTGTRRANANQAQLEFRFLRRYLLEGKFGDAGVFAADLYWSKRY